MMLLEHPHTYTLGRRALEEDLVYGEAQRAALGISLFRIDRGGRATYHGPGQLVGYPILALGERYDVIEYLRNLEEVLIRTAADLGVEAARDPQHTGVWVGSNKIGAIGVKITRGITMHGFAFNVTTDLSMFDRDRSMWDPGALGHVGAEGDGKKAHGQGSGRDRGRTHGNGVRPPAGVDSSACAAGIRACACGGFIVSI